MLCSRITTAFLSWKTDFLERMAAWHGPISWRGCRHHRLEERGLGCPLKVQCLQCGGAPRILLSPVPCCAPRTHPAAQEAAILQNPRGASLSPDPQISAAEGTASSKAPLTRALWVGTDKRECRTGQDPG